MKNNYFKMEYPQKIPDDIIKKCANSIKEGNIIIYPSDTCYMFSADAFNKKAVDKIYELKSRDTNKPMSVLVKDYEMLMKIADISNNKIDEIKRYLPGLYTLLFPIKKDITYCCIGNSDRIGIRIMNYLPANKLMNRVNIPIITTSANLSNQKSPFNFTEILNQFRESIYDNVNVILDIGDLKSDNYLVL